MRIISFTKMHGLGNSYIYLDGWVQPDLEPHLVALARTVACPHYGIGADGLIWMGPSHQADLKMRIFNKDGSEGKNCGNGLRCVAKYVYEQKYVSKQQMTIETLGGVMEATLLDHQGIQALVSVKMGQPRLARHEIPMSGKGAVQVVAEPFEIGAQKLSLTAVSIGNPHAVFFVPTLEDAPHQRLGPLIERDSRFPEGVNVEFVRVHSSTSLQMRVWERGSGVTQACGTGACAVAVAAILNGYAERGIPLTVHLEGGDLQISWEKNGDLLMTGPATTVASGTAWFPL